MSLQDVFALKESRPDPRSPAHRKFSFLATCPVLPPLCSAASRCHTSAAGLPILPPEPGLGGTDGRCSCPLICFSFGCCYGPHRGSADAHLSSFIAITPHHIPPHRTAPPSSYCAALHPDIAIPQLGLPCMLSLIVPAAPLPQQEAVLPHANARLSLTCMPHAEQWMD
jgi:hypothetical protein